jgi:serine protein kinase
MGRMILESEIEKVVVNGKTTYDFSIFRKGKKHIIGMYDEINSFVSYVKDAAEGRLLQGDGLCAGGRAGQRQNLFRGLSVCHHYRSFLSQPANRKYTFRFTGLDKFGATARFHHRIPDL